MKTARTLSVGQAQRVGIARALYRQPEVLFLDEFSSAIDEATESEILATLLNLKGNVTIIMVAHRLNLIKKSDEIFLMNDGKIVERGTFNQISKFIN